jgi:predicted transposase/invertase (TIGR01784 family)
MNDALPDHLFRSIFGMPERAAAELRSVLPAAITAALDWPSLAPVSGSFVDEELRGREADLLFTARRHDGGDALVYLLFEHQSTFDRWLPLRLLDYMTRIWQRWRRDHPRAARPPRIVAVVLHQGEEPWPAGTRFGELFEDAQGQERDPFDETSVDFRFVVDDLTSCSDAQIRGRALDAVAMLALLSLRHARSASDLQALLVEWAVLLNAAITAPGGREALMAVLRYLSRVKETRGPPLFTEARLPMVSAEVRAMGKTAAQWWVEEGRQEGRTAALRDILRQLLRQRFGMLATERMHAIDSAGAGDLERWLAHVIDAATIDAVFAD